MTSQSLIKTTLKSMDPASGKKFVIGPAGSEGAIITFSAGEIFDAIPKLGESMKDGIKGLPQTANNFKKQCAQLGYNAIGSAASGVSAAASGITAVQSALDVNRTTKPSVQKGSNIALIPKAPPKISEIAQDVVQFLGRVTASSSGDTVDKLWTLLLTIPLISICEVDKNNKKISDTYEAYSKASEIANKTMETNATRDNESNIVSRNANKQISATPVINNNEVPSTGTSASISTSTINNVISEPVISSEPNINDIGICVNDDIVDMAFDYDNSVIYLADNKNIYKIDETKEAINILNIPDSDNVSIKKIFFEDGYIYFVSQNNKGIYKVSDSTYTLLNVMPNDINAYIYADKTIMLTKNGVYPALYYKESDTPIAILNTAGTVKAATYNVNTEIGYFAVQHNNSQKIYSVSKLNGIYSQISEVTDNNLSFGEITNLAVFNDVLYITFNNNGSYNIKKKNINYNFNNYNYSQDCNILFSSDSFITDGNTIYSHSLINNVVTLNTVASSIPTSISCVINYTYNNKDYLIATSGSNILVAEINNQSSSFKENWVVKNINYNSISGSAPSMPECFSGCFIYNNSLYIYTRNRIYHIPYSNFNSLFDGISSTTSVLPDSITDKTVSDWVNSTAIINSSELVFDYYYDMPDYATITSFKKVSNNFYIGLFNPSSTSKEQQSKIQSQAEERGITLNKTTGVYTIEFNGSSYSLSDSPIIEPSNNDKIFDFDNVSNKWYFVANSKLYEINGSEAKEVKEAKLLDGQMISSISHNTNGLIIYLNNEVKYQTSETKYSDLLTHIKFEDADLKLCYTNNSIIISDGKYVYNVIDNEAISDDVYQIIYQSNNVKIAQSRNSAFIYEQNSYKDIPINDKIIGSDYNIGYFTDTMPNKWCGAAPYDYISKVLQNKKYSCPRNQFIQLFYNSFKYELDKLLKLTPNAFINTTSNELIDYLSTRNITVENDVDGIVSNEVIKSAANVCANELGIYVTDRFDAKIGDEETYTKFANKVLELAYVDNDNNLTKDFYDAYKEVFDELMSEALMGYHSIISLAYDKYDATLTSRSDVYSALSSYVIKYYNNHAQEWYEKMSNMISEVKVPSEIYLAPLDASTYTIDITSYRYDTIEQLYTKKFCGDPSIEYTKEHIVYGYLHNNVFYRTKLDGGSYADPVVPDEYTIYIDKEPVQKECSFEEEDREYHEKFYEILSSLKETIEIRSLADAKIDALTKLSSIDYFIDPSYEWKAVIADSFSKLYTPAQYEDYLTIIDNSNMYEINWDELPESIDAITFDTALTMVLDYIKDILKTITTLLIIEKQIPCYSCMDVCAIINKIVSKNANIYKNQIDIIKNAVRNAATIDEVKNAFDSIVPCVVVPTNKYIVDIYDSQSELYAKYLNPRIKSVIINNENIEAALQ